MVGEALATVQESAGSESESDDEVLDREPDDHSSTRSEYAFGSDVASGPTPVASFSPAPTPIPAETRSTNNPYPSAPIPIYAPRQSLHTRSSTPSSVSSPLALAAPIVAPSSQDDILPHMTLDDGPRIQIKTRKSAQNLLEPKFIITPHVPTVRSTRWSLIDSRDVHEAWARVWAEFSRGVDTREFWGPGLKRTPCACAQ